MMIGIDSSVLLRYIMDDDPRWSAAATRFIDANCNEKTPGYINPVVLAEVVWTLRTTYGFDLGRAALVVKELLESSSFVVAHEGVVRDALLKCEKTGAGFADSLIAALNKAAGAEPTYAIDKKAVKGAIFRELPE